MCVGKDVSQVLVDHELPAESFSKFNAGINVVVDPLVRVDGMLE